MADSVGPSQATWSTLSLLASQDIGIEISLLGLQGRPGQAKQEAGDASVLK